MKLKKKKEAQKQKTQKNQKNCDVVRVRFESKNQMTWKQIIWVVYFVQDKRHGLCIVLSCFNTYFIWKNTCRHTDTPTHVCISYAFISKQFSNEFICLLEKFYVIFIIDFRKNEILNAFIYGIHDKKHSLFFSSSVHTKNQEWLSHLIFSRNKVQRHDWCLMIACDFLGLLTFWALYSAWFHFFFFNKYIQCKR